MLPSDFIYASNFPTLLSGDVQTGIDAVGSMYRGIITLFADSDSTTQTNKQKLLTNLLVAWWLSNMFPTAVEGVMSAGGLPVSSKSIGGVSVSFPGIATDDPSLQPLLSNTFGMQALQMYLSAPERFKTYG